VRWFLMSSSILRGGNLIVGEEGIRDGVRQVLLPLWSTYYFFTLYANTAGDSGYTATRRTDSTNVLDRYLLAKTGEVLDQVTQHLEDLDSPFAANALRDFGDVLTNWYVRRSRDRFWAGDDRDAFDTLFTVLETMCRMTAPLLPLVTEEIWRGLTEGRSVHLEDWPDAAVFPAADDIRTAMDAAREVSSVANALRKREGKRVRLPLSTLTVVVPDAACGYDQAAAASHGGAPITLGSCGVRVVARAAIAHLQTANSAITRASNNAAGDASCLTPS